MSFREMMHRRHSLVGGLRLFLVMVIFLSTWYNGFLSFSNDVVAVNVHAPQFVAPDQQKGSNNININMNINNNIDPRPKLILGIPSSEEMKHVILNTYLNQTSQNQHGFPNACDLSSNNGLPLSSRDCSVWYQFQEKNSSMVSFWRHVFALQKKQEQQNDFSKTTLIILWVTSSTILYPRYFYDMLQELLWSSFRGNDNDQDDDKLPLKLLFAKTRTVDCSRQRSKPDKVACKRMSGDVTLISKEALDLILQISKQEFGNNTTNNNNNNNNKYLGEKEEEEDFYLSLIQNTTRIKSYYFPRQYQRPTPETFQDFWQRLVTWNDNLYNKQMSVDFVTAKFGRGKKFAQDVDLARTALTSFGYDPHDIYAYSEFPSFIMKDPQWQPHLQFLYNTTLKPKGAGYWFWKAPLLLHHLQRRRRRRPRRHAKKEIGSKDHFVVFADVDLRDHHSWLVALMQQMLDINASLAMYQVEYHDRNYTKRDCYDFYCPHKDQAKDDSVMYAGGWLVVKQTPGTITLVEQWQQGLANYSMLNDSPSIRPNIPAFEYHLHDQSILSALVKCQYTQAYTNRVAFLGSHTLKSWVVHLLEI